MENKISIGLLNRKGQSTVEYILLMAVLVVLAMGVFNNAHFKNFFSKDGKFFKAVAKGIEHSYRNALYVEDNNLSYNAPHPSFYNPNSGSGNEASRFFTGVEAYPN